MGSTGSFTGPMTLPDWNGRHQSGDIGRGGICFDSERAKQVSGSRHQRNGPSSILGSESCALHLAESLDVRQHRGRQPREPGEVPWFYCSAVWPDNHLHATVRLVLERLVSVGAILQTDPVSD